MSDYEPSDGAPMKLGVFAPSILTSPQTSAGELPWAPAVEAQPAPTTAEPAQAQPDGVNRPVPMTTYPHPELGPDPSGRPSPFQPAGSTHLVTLPPSALTAGG